MCECVCVRVCVCECVCVRAGLVDINVDRKLISESRPFCVLIPTVKRKHDRSQGLSGCLTQGVKCVHIHMPLISAKVSHLT